MFESMVGTNLLGAMCRLWATCLAVLVLFFIQSASAADPTVDVAKIDGSISLQDVRGVIEAPSAAVEVDVKGPNGQPMTMNLDSKGKGPKYHWSLFAFVNSAAEPRTLVIEIPRQSFVSSRISFNPQARQPGSSTVLNVTSNQPPGKLEPLAGSHHEGFSFTMAPGENLTLAIESASGELPAHLWYAATYAGHIQKWSYFAGALLGIAFVVSFACLALYGLRGHKVTRAGAAFAFSSLLFLINDMGIVSNILQALPSQIEPRHVSAVIEAAMLSSLFALLHRFRSTTDTRSWLSATLMGLFLVSLLNLVLAFIFPERVSALARIAFLVVAAMGLPVLLRTRTRGEETFEGVVLVWCFILGWAAFAAFVAYASSGSVLMAPMFWAALVATITMLGMLLYKHALAATAANAFVQENTEALAVSGAGHAIWDWHPIDNRLTVGPQLNEALGFGFVDTSSSTQQFMDQLHPEDQPMFKTLIAEAVSGTTPFLHAFLRLHAADESYRPFLLRARVMENETGRLSRFVGTLTEQPLEFPLQQYAEPEVVYEPEPIQPVYEETAPPPKPMALRKNEPRMEIPKAPVVVSVAKPPEAPAASEPQSPPIVVERAPPEPVRRVVVETPPSQPTAPPPSATPSSSFMGLTDRSEFMDRLESLLVATGNQTYRVLLIGIDRFKVLNEGLGHAAGDLLLQLVAKRLSAGLASGDVACRMSGSQFAIFLPEDQNAMRGPDMARNVTVNLGKPIMIEGRDIAVTASIGMSTAGRTPYSAEDLLAQATSALLVAKSRGVAQYAQYEMGMRDDRPVQLSLEQDLRRAIERREIEVQYQPITRLDSFELAGFEALVRWNHPERGVVSPADFIDLAEQAGFIAEIGRFVLGEAARQLGVWQRTLARSRQMFMAVNVSATQLLDEGFTADVERLLARESIAPGTLKLEVTESVVIKYPERLKLLFAHLKSRGVSLACDDFGTGFSSLSLLRELPFDTLKVDKSFLSPRGLDERSRHVLETILELAHGLNMTVVTEGIENEEMADDMSLLGFDYGQGYYFGMAGPANEVQDLLAVLPRMIEAEGLPPMQPLEPYDMPQQLPSIYEVESEKPDGAKTHKLKTVRRNKKQSGVTDVS